MDGDEAVDDFLDLEVLVMIKKKIGRLRNNIEVNS